MNPWDKRRKLSKWSGGYVEWTDTDTAYLSVVFSWHLQKAYQRAVWFKSQGYCIKAGGPAVDLNPTFLADIAECGGKLPSLHRHNPDATFTTRGCIRHCAFCAVPRIEGNFVELEDWPIKPIICDNNFLASSHKHFDGVIDKLKPLHNVDFNQGLDARLLTPYHADRLAELDVKWLRLAWDDARLEDEFRQTHTLLRNAGIPAGKIAVYVLIGFRDTPEDALYRLNTVWKELKSWPFPMRYQPLDAQKRNAYIGENWTDYELRRYTRYWTNLRHLSGIPFNEFHL